MIYDSYQYKIIFLELLNNKRSDSRVGEKLSYHIFRTTCSHWAINCDTNFVSETEIIDAYDTWYK